MKLFDRLAPLLQQLRSAITWRRVVVGVVVLGFLGVGLLMMLNNTLTPAALRSMLAELGMWGPVALVVALAGVLVVPVIPASAFQVGAGLAFGPVLGLACVVIADVLGASVGFGLARLWGRSLLDRRLSPEIKSSVARLAQRLTWRSVLLLRLLPGPVYPVVSFAAGYSPLSFASYTLASLAGVLPGLALLVVAGDTFEHSPILAIALVLLLLASLALAKHLTTDRSNARRDQST